MRKSRIKFAVAGLAALSLITAACGGSDSSSDTTAAAEEGCTELTPVKLQLQWFIQAQFAGYFAAQDQGFYEAQCLDVQIVEGGVDIVPQQQLADGAVFRIVVGSQGPRQP